MEAPITRICKLIALAPLGALLLATPAEARLEASDSNPAWIYVQARTAAMNGDHARSAQLLATMIAVRPNDRELARKAMVEAINSGRFDLAMRLASRVPATEMSGESRLLLVADMIKRGRHSEALPWLVKYQDGSDLGFLRPLVETWAAAESGNLNSALRAIASVPADSALNAFKSEQTALVLLKFRRTADAEPFARRALGGAGGRETRLRLALAQGFLDAGDRARAEIMLDGIADEAQPAKAALLAGRLKGQAIDSGAKVFSEVLTDLSANLARLNRGTPIGLAQVAVFANPQNSGANVLLAVLLNLRSRPDQALAALERIRVDDPLIGQVRDTQIRILIEHKRFNEAYRIAFEDANALGARAGEWSRLGDVYVAMKRQHEAAVAYSKAISAARQAGTVDRLWTLYLLQASALEESGQWPEAREALQQGLLLSPEQPLLLNFLGYAKLERGEDLESAEAMIRKASELSPDNASITDSLGWALYKRGKIEDAIKTLREAAVQDPAQAEIHEHLGDALFASGRRFEARHSWSAALVTAEDDIKQRVESKIQRGLTPANAAP